MSTDTSGCTLKDPCSIYEGRINGRLAAQMTASWGQLVSSKGAVSGIILVPTNVLEWPEQLCHTPLDMDMDGISGTCQPTVGRQGHVTGTGIPAADAAPLPH